MILEAIILNVRAGQEAAFEADFARASPIIAGTPGYLSHELLRCFETTHRYIFLARWKTLEAHTVGFRQSAGYPEWKRLLHHYYDPMPTVQHFRPVFTSSPPHGKP
jgi:heme-degrading monooxygenase HmoA